MTASDTALRGRVRTRAGHGAARRSLRRLLGDRSARIAGGIVLAIVLLAVLAPVLPLPHPNAQDLTRTFEAASWDHWLGTDRFGRDVLSRLIHAARVSLVAGVASVAIATLIGVPLGLLAGYRRGWVDAATSRVSDAFLSMPALILAIAIAGIRSPGLLSVILAIGVIFWPRLYRVSRGVALGLREEPYITAARAVGCSSGSIVRRHVLRNAMTPLMVQVAFLTGLGITAEASLSFAGLGVQPPQSSWGTMIHDGYELLYDHPFAIVPPALMIIVTVAAFAILADAIRDALGRVTR